MSKGKEIKKETTKKATVQKKDSAKKTKETKVRPKVPATALREITTKSKKIMASFKEPTYTALERDAEAGIKFVQSIAGTALKNDGKLSPLGHMASRQNGILDTILLQSGKPDFGMWVKEVAKRNPSSRRTALDDNKALLKRLQEHLRFIAGRSETAAKKFKKTLEKVGLAEKAEDIMNSLCPTSILFDEYVKNF